MVNVELINLKNRLIMKRVKGQTRGSHRSRPEPPRLGRLSWESGSQSSGTRAKVHQATRKSMEHTHFESRLGYMVREAKRTTQVTRKPS